MIGKIRLMLAAALLGIAAASALADDVKRPPRNDGESWEQYLARLQATGLEQVPVATPSGGVQDAPQLPATPYLDALQWAATLEVPGSGGWQFVGIPNDAKSATFATARMSSRKGELATVWFRSEERESQTVMSSAARYEFDCAIQTMRTVTTINYTKNNLEGDATERDSASRHSPILPGSLGEAMLAWACSHTKPKPLAKPSSPASG